MIGKIGFIALSMGLVFGCSAPTPAPPSPVDLLFADGQKMEMSRSNILAGDSLSLQAFQVLKQQADEALTQGPFSVMDKTQDPPGGDKHDYMSQGPYWWPDPEKPDGLPYIRRDGEVNPESRGFTDHQYMGKLINLTDVLGKAWYFSGEEKYAAHAAQLIRVWFLDSATRMNPHLNYGQAIPGRVEGRGIGIIETRSLGLILDAISLIRTSGQWSEADEAGMQTWCRAYLDWLTNSQHGKEESVHPNNHGTWYDVQAAALAVYTGQVVVARELATLALTRRLDAHIEADGSQPHELARTRSWDYSCMNLWGLFQMAQIAERVGENHWQYPAAQESKLRQALDYLLPFALGEKDWPHEQIKEFEANKLLPHLRIASKVFPDADYGEAIVRIMDAAGQEIEAPMLWE